MPRRVLSRLLIVAVMVVLAACQVDVTVDLDVAQDGSGTVQVEAIFDAEAEEAIGGLASQFRVRDLEAAGWDVAFVETDDAGSTAVASKPVASAEQWQQVLDEIAGPGVFNDVQVTSDSRFATSSQQLRFDLNLSDGWTLFADDELTETLGGEPFGAPIDSLTDDRSIDDIVMVSITTTVVSDNQGRPATESYEPRFGDGETLQVRLESTTENSTAVLLRWIAIALFSLFVLAAVLAIVGVVLQRRADRLRPAPRPASMASRVPGAAAPAAATITPSQPDAVRLVIVEPLSVLYGQARTIEDVLLPFVRDHDGSARADTILQGYNGLITGSTETTTFWELCGIHADGAGLDTEYISSRVLHPGAADFFKEMQRRRIPIAATSNDAAKWSHLVRDRDRLSAVWPWLVSSEVGATTNNVGMFEVLRRESGIAHGHCLYVDVNVESLDAARDLGMKTALFDTGDLELPAVIDHPVVTDFKGLFGKA